MNDALPGSLPDLRDARRRLDRLQVQAEHAHARHAAARDRAGELEAFLDLAPAAQARLDELTQLLFGRLLDDMEGILSQAIREILGQERRVVTERQIKGGALHVDFGIESPDGPENLLRGQGGSVCNIVSAGLRLIALSRLDPARHRPFLVLDEGDCWLRPDLVPKFMDIIARTARLLGLQALVISHHPLDLFALKADRIFALTPDRDNGVKVVTVLAEGRKGKRLEWQEDEETSPARGMHGIMSDREG